MERSTLSELRSKLLNLDEDWEERVSALQRLETIVDSELCASFVETQLPAMITAVVEQLKDKRSLVVKQACMLLRHLFENFDQCGLRRASTGWVCAAVPILLRNLAVTIKVISQSSVEALEAIVLHTIGWNAFFIEGLTDKHSAVRRECARLLGFYALHGALSHAELAALNSATSDSDNIVRSNARQAIANASRVQLSAAPSQHSVSTTQQNIHTPREERARATREAKPTSTPKLKMNLKALGDVKLSDAKHNDMKHSDAKHNDTKPSDSKINDSKIGENRSTSYSRGVKENERDSMSVNLQKLGGALRVKAASTVQQDQPLRSTTPQNTQNAQNVQQTKPHELDSAQVERMNRMLGSTVTLRRK
jgi:hypothetical protein